MAITYSAGAGTHVTSSASNSTVKSFTGGKVRLENTISVINNGNIDDTFGPTYAFRMIRITGGTGSGQKRFISAQTTGQGDGNDVDIDVSEPWDTNPDNTSTYEISYVAWDAETLGGLSLIARSGFWEWARELVVESGGYIFMTGEPHEWNDEGSTTVGSWQVESGGTLDIGYSNAGTAVAGTTNVVINGTAGEWGLDLQSGSEANFYDMTLIGTLANNKISVTGGTHVWQKGKMQTVSYGTLLSGTMTISDWTFAGAGTTNDWIRIEDTVSLDGIVLTDTNGWDSLDDTLTETLEVRNCLFLNTVTRNVWVHDDKTWNFVNPVNLGADSTLIAFEVDDLNEVNVLFSLDIAVAEPDGTAIVDADCYVYEGTLNQDLPTANRVDTDSNGLASTDVLLTKFTYPSSVFTTATSGEHALKVYEWLKTPFVTALSPDTSVTGGLTVGVTLIDDPNIVQTTQATAISNGSGITIERPTNATQLLSYDTGTIAFVVGDVVDGAGGAQGTVTEITEGDTTSGRIHLRLRNGTAFVAGEDLDVSAVKKAQATNPLVALDFSTHIDCDAKSLQVNYDYWAARQAEDSISADGITSLEWGEGEHAQIVFADGGGDFRTERNVGLTDGVFISDRGAGGITYMTADDGTQYTPPTSVTVEITVKDTAGAALVNAAVYVQNSAGPFNDTDHILRDNTNGSGVASAPYNYVSDTSVTVRSRLKGYITDNQTQTITADGLTLTITLRQDPNQE
jgi:hypothetical protein